MSWPVSRGLVGAHYIEFAIGSLAMAGGIWAPFKEVVRVVNDAILRKEPSAYYKLEAELKRHKPDFISLLKNPVSTLRPRF